MSDSAREIANLIYSYAERLDAGDFKGVGALFARGAISNQGIDTASRGADEVVALYEQWTRLYPDGTPRTKHVTTNLICEIDEAAGTAEVRSYFTVFQQTDSLPLQPIIAGRYRDSFERVKGTWHFSNRFIISDLAGDLSQHLLQAIPSDARP